MAYENAVVLTGGIATGKSSAGAILSLLGFRVIDADSIAHNVLNNQALAISDIFGKEYIDSNGRVDRKALGKLIFSDEESKRALENLVHPLIREEILKKSQEQEKLKKPYFIDIPLFFETKEYPIERVVVVYAPREIQKERLINRENLSSEDAEARLNAQIDIEKKKAEATWVIDNSGDLKQLQKECERVREEILNSF